MGGNGQAESRGGNGGEEERSWRACCISISEMLIDVANITTNEAPLHTETEVTCTHTHLLKDGILKNSFQLCVLASHHVLSAATTTRSDAERIEKHLIPVSCPAAETQRASTPAN